MDMNTARYARALAYLRSHEGPRTPFVLMQRACDFAAAHPEASVEAANALWALLDNTDDVQALS